MSALLLRQFPLNQFDQQSLHIGAFIGRVDFEFLVKLNIQIESKSGNLFFRRIFHAAKSICVSVFRVNYRTETQMKNKENYLPVFSKLIECQNAIEQKEEELKVLKGSIPSILEEIAREAPYEKRLNWASALYWSFLDLQASPILNAFRLQQREILPEIFGINCPKCGCHSDVHCASRAELSEWKKGKGNPCPVCAKKWHEEHQSWLNSRDEEEVKREMRLIELRTMPYRQYLASPEWKERRLGRLKVANYRCQLCNNGGKLDVHHRTYERRGDESPKDLIVLCGDCHSRFHGKLKDIPDE